MKILEGLIPTLQAKAKALVDECAQASIPIRITSGLRTWEEQEKLYAQGRTTPGRIVTYSEPGRSWHNWGRAFDVCFVGDDPYLEKLEKTDMRAFQIAWGKVGVMGEKLGLEWGGRFTRPIDRPHFQIQGLVTLAGRCAIKEQGVIDLKAISHFAERSIQIAGVSAVQLLLKRAGLYAGSVDGYLGPKTAQALQILLEKDSFGIEDIEKVEGLRQA